MSFINEASGICLSPTGGTGECPEENYCEGNQYIKSGQMITIANTCNMPLTITGFHNDNPERFTIINYPEFSGSGYYTTGNVTGNPDSLPRILEPGENWEIMTWWHPEKLEVESADVGTPARPTGTAQSAKISVLPGDLGFADCANYFTLSGEMVCDKVPITLGTGALGTYIQTLSDLPDPPPNTVCLRSSKYVYQSFRVYPNATDLGNDQTEGLYQLMSWIGGQISGNANEHPRIRNIARGFTTGVRQVIDAGNDNDLANLFTFPIPLANSVLYNAADNALDPLTGSFKTSTVVPTGSGTLMQLGEGYTGINILESRYDDVGAGPAWQNQNDNYGAYVSSGLTDTSNLTVRMFIAQSGYQSLRAGTTIKNSICTQPVGSPGTEAITPFVELGPGPAVGGPTEGDFDWLEFAGIFPNPAPIFDPPKSKFNFFIIPDLAAEAAFWWWAGLTYGSSLRPFHTDDPFMGGPKKGGIIMTVNDDSENIRIASIMRRAVSSSLPVIVNVPDPANPGAISVPWTPTVSNPVYSHTWAPDAGPVGTSAVRAPTIFDLNDNGKLNCAAEFIGAIGGAGTCVSAGVLRYSSEWIVNGDIEIASTIPPYDTVVNTDGTSGPGNLADTNMSEISIEKNLSTDGFIWVKFTLSAAGNGNFFLRGGT